jgi:four helix bundle protein
MCAAGCEYALSVVHDFGRLQVWQRSRELMVTVDGLTRNFPRSDRGVVAGQVRRAVLSIAANIAEGCGKSSRKETIRFLQIASGSAVEAECHVLLATDLRYLPPRASHGLLDQIKSIQRMLRGLMANLPD